MTTCLVALFAFAVPADPPGVGTAISVHISLTDAEYKAMQPRRAPGGFFGPQSKKTAPPKDDPSRELHRNTFGMDLPWATGTVTIGDQTFADVGVRYKGNGTIGDAGKSIKKSFKIDLDRRGGTGRFRGSKSINLHCGVADPSKYREVLGYSLYRAAGVPAPRSGYAEVRITVPGKHDRELLGLYTVTEEVDGAFLRDRFGSAAGLLMKPEGVREIEYRGDRWDRYKGPHRPKRDATADEGKRVVAFARLIHKAEDAEFAKEIDSFINTDQYLRYLAVTAFIANPDSFFALGHNYYLYLHPNGKFQFIPWDLDRAFANLPVLGTNIQQMDLSLSHPYSGKHRLTERILALPGMTDKYQALLKELSATAFDRERLLKQLDTAEAGLKELMARDAKAATARKDSQSSGMMFGKPPDLRTFVTRRTASMADQLAGRSKGHIPASGAAKLGDMLAGPVLENWDANGDGKLARSEWLALSKRVFNASKPDTDGTVDRKSLASGLNNLLTPQSDDGPKPPPGFSLGEQMAGPILTRADADKNGKLTAAELTVAAESLFNQIDTAKTGTLDGAAFAKLLTTLFPKL